MLAAIKPDDYVVALEVAAAAMSTAALGTWLAGRLREARPLALLIGGPDGLAPACLARADQAWSLSPLTLPHGLVRVVVAEQLYRAMSLLGRPPVPSSLIRYPGGMSAEFVYLASESPRRRELLRQIGVPFRVLGVGVDEAVHPGEAADAYVTRLAAAKARHGWDGTRAAGTEPVLGGGHDGGGRRPDPRQTGRRGRGARDARTALGPHPRGVDRRGIVRCRGARDPPEPQRSHLPDDPPGPSARPIGRAASRTARPAATPSRGWPRCSSRT